MSPRRSILRWLAIAVVLGLPGSTAVAGAQDASNSFTFTEEYFVSSDGVRLHVNVLRPEDMPLDEPAPVLLEVSPYHSSSGDMAGTSQPYRAPEPSNVMLQAGGFARGFINVQVELPGTGASAGCMDFGGPSEQAAAVSAVDWVAEQPWSNGRIAMTGKSYPGYATIMAMAGHPEALKLALPVAPASGRHGLYFFNSVPFYGYNTTVPGSYAALMDASPPGVLSPPAQFENLADQDPAALGSCYAGAQEYHTALGDVNHPYWVARDLSGAKTADLAMFWHHGFLDRNTPITALMEIYPDLAGPKSVMLGQFVHEVINPRWLYSLQMALMEHFLREDPGPLPEELTYSYVQDIDRRWRVERQYPPADVATHRVFDLRVGEYTDVGGNNTDSEWTPTVGRLYPVNYNGAYPYTTGVGVWTIGEPLVEPLRFSGAPRITATVQTSEDRPGILPPKIAAAVYSVDAGGKAHFLTRGTTLVREDGEVTFDLLWQDVVMQPGERIGVLITGADDWWWEYTYDSNDTMQVTSGYLELPVLSCARTTFLDHEDELPPFPRFGPIPVPADALAQGDVPTNQPPAPRTEGTLCSTITPQLDDEGGAASR